MSVSFFLGIKKSYADAGREEAIRFIEAINQVLKPQGFPEYIDDKHNSELLPGIGRSRLSNFGYSGLSEFVSVAKRFDMGRPFEVCGPREVYVPFDLPDLLSVPFGRFLWFTRKAIIGSSQHLQQTLLNLAPHLRIPIVDGNLTDEVARQISDRKPFSDEDDEAMTENVRLAWLLYFEGARLSVQTQQALCLSG